MIRAAVVVAVLAQAIPASAHDLPRSCAALAEREGFTIPARPSLTQKAAAYGWLIAAGCSDPLVRRCRSAVGVRLRCGKV